MLFLLLKDDGVAGVESGQDFGAGSVGDACLDGDSATSLFLLGVGNLDRGVAVFVVEDGLFGDGEDVLVLFEDDFGVGGHVGLELAAGIVDGDANLEGGDVVLLDAKGSDAGDLAEEGLVFEGFHLDAGGLAEIDLADIGLIDLALDVDLVDVADGHDEGGGAAEDEDGGDGIAFFHVAGEDHTVHG